MIHTGDCLDVMASMDADSVDAIVTDPPCPSPDCLIERRVGGHWCITHERWVD